MLDLKKLCPPPALTGPPEGSEGKLKCTLFIEEAGYLLEPMDLLFLIRDHNNYRLFCLLFMLYLFIFGKKIFKWYSDYISYDVGSKKNSWHQCVEWKLSSEYKRYNNE